ncbi:DUF2262 domain-containing protein [Paenibacillus sp. MER 99-2]|uniref:DUF2262 domain-containing protein n=1 Tax=Paenibacillus sp. MER 99-2 TaxID=2939572 RepID=UPI00203B2110|nr:DUF2262 domain-containing protein [Paenibacillus sp. MER 99-2]MCM3172986.1 DUF2262 domain-containing protein [Paenibacillus sp. MER 99-2]
MQKVIHSKIMGSFKYDEQFNTYEHTEGKVYYTLRLEQDCANVDELMSRAEKIFCETAEFENKAKAQVAHHLIDYKNDFWPEYDEDDENLNWDDVDAGKYDVSIEDFVKAIILLDIEIRKNQIYCEFSDGDLFGGHRIHAGFDYEYRLIQADV